MACQTWWNRHCLSPIITSAPIPNQSSVAKAWQEFDDDGRMKPSPCYDRVVDVMEELVKFTLLTRGRADYLVDRYIERKGDAVAAALARAASAAAS